jgi:hypothetical protein
VKNKIRRKRLALPERRGCEGVVSPMEFCLSPDLKELGGSPNRKKKKKNGRSHKTKNKQKKNPRGTPEIKTQKKNKIETRCRNFIEDKI